MEMSRACCCSVSHADAISPITTIQWGQTAMGFAKRRYSGGRKRADLVSVLKQVVSECDGE